MKIVTVITGLVLIFIGLGLIMIPIITNKFPQSKAVNKADKAMVFFIYIMFGLVAIAMGIARLLGKF